MQNIWKSLRMLLWMMVLTGFAYPLFVTTVTHYTMETQAAGGFLTLQGKTVGAKLIGQQFTQEKYFWGRPSAHDYNPLMSGGSNLGPTSKALKDIVEERRQRLARSYSIAPEQVPPELIFASGSGLDPHISYATAIFQLERIQRARGWEKPADREKLLGMIERLKGKTYLANPFVNVLELNIALDSWASE